MRIAIDGYNLALTHGTGVATYSYVLADMLHALGHEVHGIFGLNGGSDPKTREVLFFERLGMDEERWRARDVIHIGASSATSWGSKPLVPVLDHGVVDRRAFAGQLPRLDGLWTLPYLFEVAAIHFRFTGRFLTVHLPNPPDVMHWTYPVPVRMAGCPNIYTLHDLVPLKIPHATLDDKSYYYRLVAQCIRSAAHICTVSEASRNDILSLFDADPARVTNTYQSSPPPAGMANAAEDDAEMIRGLFGLEPRGYYLFFGALDPKKNLSRILDAYLTSQSSHPMVVVGARDWGMVTDERLAAKRNPLRAYKGNSRITQLDYQPREILFRMIRGARAVLFPSLYEGFGLPALEAMQLGTPVISSTTSSLPEVVGDAGLLVDPYNVAAISGAIRSLDRDDALGARLGQAGIVQAARFDNDNYRARLATLYSRVTTA